MNTLKVAFIGLGVMGYPLAGHLQRAGYQTTVYNRTSEKAQAWVDEYGGELKESPREAVALADIIFVCVGNDDDVRSVIFGDKGVLSGIKKGAILVDHTTTSADLAIELAQACKSYLVSFIDAPVSGGQAGAENGALTIMCGGDTAAFNDIRPVLNTYAKLATLLGGNGQGQRCKMVNQICIAGILQGLSEALLLANKASLDITQIVETLKHGAAGSWQMENRAVTMSEDKFDFGFAIDWMRKDLNICLNEAKKHQLQLPMTLSVDKDYQTLQQNGFGRMDTSVLIKASLEKTKETKGL